MSEAPAASALKVVYIVATETAEPLAEEVVREAFESDDVKILWDQDDCLFSVRAEEARVDIAFEAREEGLGQLPDLLTGTPEQRAVLEGAHGFYRVSFEPGKPQGPVAVFEALWTVRTLLEIAEGVAIDVTAFKIHSPQDVEEMTELDFDIRDHLAIHAQEAEEGDKPMWVHTHGMAKFGTMDVEMFHISEDDLAAAETFFHELCTDLAFGHGPSPRVPVATSVGRPFVMMPADEARANLRAVDPETFEGHEQHCLTIVSPEGRHTMSEILEQYRERFEEESEEEAAAMRALTERLLPLFKARFLRKGLMEPLTFVVRAPFEVHPDGEQGETDEEMLWLEAISWDDETVIGRLTDGGETTTEWRKGAQVEVDETQINALAVTREGRTLEVEEMQQLLEAERPA